MSPRRRSFLTFTDQFCGAGGSTIGARLAGLEGAMALNHWRLAIETHQTNNPDIPHDCTDVSASDPRRYPASDILITSPECTTHSPAGGNRRHTKSQRDLFVPEKEDPGLVRSRATMWDVIRFTEFHEYRVVIVENVVEVLRWPLFPTWLQAMHELGYRHRVVSINSMVCHPTPQSRDRVYVVFWRKGNRAPDLDLSPRAPCPRCLKDVEARQTWKNGRTVGKYRTQYVYTCAECRATVTPYYYAALNALDLALPAERIGDRSKPLRPRTMERIRFGLEKYGRRTLVVNVMQGERDRSRAWPADSRPIGSIPTWDDYFGLATPFLIETVNGGIEGQNPRSVMDPHRTQTTRQSAALVGPAFLDRPEFRAMDRPKLERAAAQIREVLAADGLAASVGPAAIVPNRSNTRQTGLDDPLPVVVASTTHHMLVVPPATVVTNREHSTPKGLDGPLTTVAGGNHHLLVQGAALLSMRDVNAMKVSPLDEPTMTQIAAPQTALLARAPFLVQHYGTNNASPIDRPIPVVTTIDRHELVEPGGEPLRVEDCYFRMLQPHEIGAAMAFPGTYVVLGNKRDQVRQYGNAVTPPVMAWIIARCVESLHPEIPRRRSA